MSKNYKLKYKYLCILLDQTTAEANMNIYIPCSLNCLATSLGEEPETSIQVLENKAQEARMKKR